MSDSFGTRQTLDVDGVAHSIFSLEMMSRKFPEVARLPWSLKILLENLLRHEDGRTVKPEEIEALARWNPAHKADTEIAFMPARVLLQDFTGVPAVVDLAAMREAMKAMGGDPQRINPLLPVDLVIDHSVQVDRFASSRAFEYNVDQEYRRNQERYAFLRWGQKAFDRFRVVPPGTGICHQVNLEYLGQVVFLGDDGALYPDSLVGTDSHTPMINGLGVLGWGVGGIEAEAAMLGQPVTMLIPDVIGFRLEGELPAGATATDLVLTVAELLRTQGVVGKFVEFFGPGVMRLPLADRATIANMTPEFGATVSFFPVGDETLRYLQFSARDPAQIRRIEAYCKAQGLFQSVDSVEPRYSGVLSLDLSTVQTSVAGPRRPQDRVVLSQVPASIAMALDKAVPTEQRDRRIERSQDGFRYDLGHGAVVLAAITSCTNTSNPSVMIGAGLLARNAVQRGLTTRPWVKTSLAPGSKVVTDYLDRAGLTPYLEALGFHLVGYGCTTCIGNSGPLPEPIVEAITQGNLHVAAVLSGNRNFEGRVSPHTRLNYLASPPLVVAYALAGRMDIQLDSEPLGHDRLGQPVFLKDVWPSLSEIRAVVGESVLREQFALRYAEVFEGDAAWQALPAPVGAHYAWDMASTYVRQPPFFVDVPRDPAAVSDIRGARVLALLGDSVTTDHISPAGNIARNSPAAVYLKAQGVDERDFNSYGARRGNHEVMMRGTFANIRLRNALVSGVEGGVTRHWPDGEQMSIYDAAMRYADEGLPLVIVAGTEYGTGSSRDWAAKGTRLLGVRAVLARSFERIHRSNLVGMGVLPLQFDDGQDPASLGLRGEEVLDIEGLASGLTPRKRLTVVARKGTDQVARFEVTARVDTPNEVDYLLHGGILLFVLRQLLRG
ncbi:MAG: aconitate hydratase AcnA [Pseudomonadota bacterium]